MTDIESLRSLLDGVLDDALGAPGEVAGAVAAVAVGEDEATVARGIANLNTRQPFTADTGWLLGSVTKVLTTTLVLRLVEQGLIELDQPVVRYLPDLRLADPGAATRITVRMLLNHTNGIDADALMPAEVRGRDATRSYIEALASRGTLFEPGTFLHYSNPGFVVAARIVEVQTGLPFELAIRRELFDPCGMGDATAVQTQALLRETAVGAITDPGSGRLRATRLFTLPESIAAAGATPIVTVADMLAFGRMHLARGVAPNATRILPDELTQAMATPSFDVGIPGIPPAGLGWWLADAAGTRVLVHGGACPGGLSSFAILPEHDAVICAFATGPGARSLHGTVLGAVIEELTGRTTSPLLEAVPTPPDADVAGEYASFQRRVVVQPEDDLLQVAVHVKPCDDVHATLLEGFGTPAGPGPTIPYRSIAPGLFAPVGMDPVALGGVLAGTALLAAVPAADGRPAGVHMGLRFTPRS